MARIAINYGTTYGDPAANRARVAFKAIDDNFTELYNDIKPGVQTYSLVSATASVAMTNKVIIVTPDTTGRAIMAITGGQNGNEISIINVGASTFNLSVDAEGGNLTNSSGIDVSLSEKNVVRAVYYNSLWYLD